MSDLNYIVEIFFEDLYNKNNSKEKNKIIYCNRCRLWKMMKKRNRNNNKFVANDPNEKEVKSLNGELVVVNDDN
jgi:hypothetical protein